MYNDRYIRVLGLVFEKKTLEYAFFLGFMAGVIAGVIATMG